MRKDVHRSIPLWLCTFALILVLMAAPVSCAETTHTLDAKAPTSAQYFEYTVDGGRATITKYNGPNTPKKVVVPSKLDVYPVVEIGDAAFTSMSHLKSVVLPSSLVRIGVSAFEGCSALSAISLPAKLESIGDQAFAYCAKLRKITIPKRITAIEGATFFHCDALRNVQIKGKITRIEQSAFSYCAFTSISIGSNVREIGQSAFSGCAKLKSIRVSSANQYYSSKDGVLFNKDKTALLIYPCARSASKYSIPASVRIIDLGAFSNCKSLESGKMTNAVTDIGRIAFASCKKLRNVVLSSGVRSLKFGSFALCPRLKTIEIPEGVLQIEGYTLTGGPSDMHVYLPMSLTRCGDDVYGDNNVFTPGSTLHVYAGSYAHQFAARKGYSYVLR